MRTPYRSVELTQVWEWQSRAVRSFKDCLAAEEPLEIRVNGKPLTVTMRTPGHDKELAAGFLFTEGLIDSLAQVSMVHQGRGESDAKKNVVEVELNNNSPAPEDLQRNFFQTSSCGVCGKKSIEALRARRLHAQKLKSVQCTLQGEIALVEGPSNGCYSHLAPPLALDEPSMFCPYAYGRG